MNSKTKIFSISAVLIFGTVILLGAGCGSQNVIDAEKQTEVNPPVVGQEIPDTIATESPDKFYNSIEEIAAPAGLASELKSIFGEACGKVKLTTFMRDFPVQGTDELVYVWKNKPTEEELISAFKKNGYTIEESGGGGMLLVEKGNGAITVDWDSPDRADGHEIVILAGWGE